MKKSIKPDRWNAEHYKKHSDTQFHGALDVLNKYTFKGTEHVLDIGCGDGKLTALIAQNISNGQVVGIDASANMIEAAQTSYKDIKNLSFICVPAEDFKTAEKFDLIVSFFTFHWIADQEKVFQNIFNLLKPGGTLIIKTAGGNSPVIDEVFSREHWQKQFLVHDAWHGEKNADDYKKILKDLGFTHIDVSATPASRFFPNEDDFIGFAMAWIPHVTGMSHEKSLALARDIAQHAREKMSVKDPASRIELVSPIATLWAQKPQA